MEAVNNNQFEVKPNLKNKRKHPALCTNVYLNPGLDLLATDDPVCNNTMEIVPLKKRKRSKSCDIAAFENSALDLGISKTAVNEFLKRELENVRNTATRNYLGNNKISTSHEGINVKNNEPIYLNCNLSDSLSRDIKCKASNNSYNAIGIPIREEMETDSGIAVTDQKYINPCKPFDDEISAIDHVNTTTDSINTNVTNQIFINNQTNLSISFIDKLALDSTNVSSQSLYLDDDLNESNIMEIKTITIITKKKIEPERGNSTNPFLNQSFADNTCDTTEIQENPFLCAGDTAKINEMKYNDQIIHQQQNQGTNVLIPRRLFAYDTNSSISTVNETISNVNQNEYENIDNYRPESPIYENIGDESINQSDLNVNKQSKILGHDVSQFSAKDIMNLNKLSSQANSSNESNDSRNAFKQQILKAGNKLSKKVLKKLKQTFKTEKQVSDITLNPYEVPRKPTKQKPNLKEIGIENPALNLNNSDEIEIEEIEDCKEHQYETIKTLRNTRLNMNVTPLKERVNDHFDYSQNRVNTSGKKQVRFDSTLNQEKVITGNSFDYDVQSPGFDAKIDKFHDELENCINERKFIQQNM